MRVVFARTCVVGFCLTVLFLASSCGGLLEKRQVEKNREKWRKNWPTSYPMVQSRGCFCVSYGDLELVVEGGEIVEVRDPETGGPAPSWDKEGTLEPEDVRGLYLTIDELFDEIEEMRKERNSVFEVTYDEEFGYPTSIDVDGRRWLQDDELFIGVEDVKALSTD